MRTLWLFLVFTLVLSSTISARPNLPLSATSAVLMDQTTGKLLFSRNQHTRLYPAGLTKMLTALVALDYLDPQDIIVVGPEIYTIPPGALRSGHQSGEHITVHNLLRGLMIRNGNDSGAVLALQTVQRQRNHNNIPYASAEQIFSVMMNERAQYLGAYNTNFVNPNGLHNDNHFTTAYDLALIARAFMEHPLLREIAGETEFIGNGLGDIEMEDVRTIDHHWIDSNELMSGGSFHYHYATGIRSGTTPQSGDNLAAAAERRGVRLISVVLNSEDPGRWQDARMLFDYGFATYSYHQILEDGQHMQTVVIANAKLGESDILDVFATGEFSALLSLDQLERIERSVIFNEEFVYEELNYYGNTSLLAPIGENEVLGTVLFTLDNQILYEAELRSAATVYERTLDSDMDFYIAFVRDNIFSVRALPFWTGSAGLLVGIAGVTWAISERRRSKRSWYGRR